MDILVQTREHIYHISWKGIKKVETVNWDKLKSTFDMLCSTQAEQAKKVNESSPLNAHVENGVESAKANDRAWRKKLIETQVHEGWDTPDHGGMDRVSRSLKNMKLEPQ